MLKPNKKPVFIEFYVPERFFKENAISVTITVTRWETCDITEGMYKNAEVRLKKVEGKCLPAKHEKSWIIVKYRESIVFGIVLFFEGIVHYRVISC